MTENLFANIVHPCQGVENISSSQIKFRPLQESDFETLLNWLNQPHVQQFYQTGEVDFATVVGRYTSRVLGLEPVECWLALENGREFGYLQRYRLLDFPEYAATIGQIQGWAIDLLVSPERLGMGSSMLQQFYQQFPELYWIGHDCRNVRAAAASLKAGFIQHGLYQEHENQHILLCWSPQR